MQVPGPVHRGSRNSFVQKPVPPQGKDVLMLPSFSFHILTLLVFPPTSVQLSRSVVSDSAIPRIAACQASLSITNSRSSLKPMSNILACFSCGVSPTRLQASGGQGLCQGWHRPSCILLLGLPTGVWFLQGHVLPPCQHRRLQLGGVWGLQQHPEVPQSPPVPGT